MAAAQWSDSGRRVLLGPDGRPVRRGAVSFPASALAAHYDVSHTTSQNAEHWSFAVGGDANIAFNYENRRKARRRARYETSNNPHLRGMVETKASDTVGDGPNLQMLSPDGQEIEVAWKSWADEIRLTEKLLTLWAAGKQIDGEGIGLLYDDGAVRHEVKLNLQLIESEQMGNPFAEMDSEHIYDGVYHSASQPSAYYIYDEHPEAYAYPVLPTYTGKWYEASRVIHTFRHYRIGQLRGATELGPALPFAAILRRFTLATLDAAEIAAQISLWLETDATPDEGPQTYSDGAFTQMPTTRNMLITAPYGWHAKQIKSEQPIDTYESFVRVVVTQMGKSIGMPAALSYGDSSSYNMASGRLDFQTYIRGIETDRRAHLETDVLEKIFFLWMQFYAASRSGISPSSIDAEYLAKAYPHRWAYRPILHSDPEKQSAADVNLYQAGLLTMDQYLYRHNIDPESHYEQLKRQAQRLADIGMPAPGMMPGMPTGGQSNDEQ